MQFPYGRSELDNNKDMTAIITSTVVVTFLIVAGSACLCWILLAKHRGKKQESEQLSFQAADVYRMKSVLTNTFKQASLEELPLYIYQSLANATSNFHSQNKLGKGDFNQVYKGKLLDGQEIAVKRLSKTSGQGIEEFMNEVVIHRNKIHLIGGGVHSLLRGLVEAFFIFTEI